MLENIRDRPRQKFTPSLIKDIKCSLRSCLLLLVVIVRVNGFKSYVTVVGKLLSTLIEI